MQLHPAKMAERIKVLFRVGDSWRCKAHCIGWWVPIPHGEGEGWPLQNYFDYLSKF